MQIQAVQPLGPLLHIAMAELRASYIGRLGLSCAFLSMAELRPPSYVGALGLFSRRSRLYILIAELRVFYVCRFGLYSRGAPTAHIHDRA
jgi:hypothetical protein